MTQPSSNSHTRPYFQATAPRPKSPIRATMFLSHVPSCDQNPQFDNRSPCSIAIPTKTAKRRPVTAVLLAATSDRQGGRHDATCCVHCQFRCRVPVERGSRCAPRHASQTVCCSAGGPSLGMEDTVPCALGSDGGSQRNCRAPAPTQLTKRC